MRKRPCRRIWRSARKPTTNSKPIPLWRQKQCDERPNLVSAWQEASFRQQRGAQPTGSAHGSLRELGNQELRFTLPVKGAQENEESDELEMAPSCVSVVQLRLLCTTCIDRGVAEPNS